MLKFHLSRGYSVTMRDRTLTLAEYPVVNVRLISKLYCRYLCKIPARIFVTNGLRRAAISFFQGSIRFARGLSAPCSVAFSLSLSLSLVMALSRAGKTGLDNVQAHGQIRRKWPIHGTSVADDCPPPSQPAFPALTPGARFLHPDWC